MSNEDEHPLVFAWRRPRGEALILLGFVGLSVFAHAATFFIFQLSEPPRVSVPPPAPQVSLLTPSTPESKALLETVEAENPALVARLAHAEPKNLVEPIYRPSFLTPRTAPRTIAEEPEKTTFPAGRDALDVIESVSPARVSPGSPPAPSLTRLRFSEGLANRPFNTPPDFRALTHNPLDAAQFLLGVNSQGQVMHAFLQHSTGDTAADVEAATRLLRTVFVPADGSMAWGFVTVVWGDDAYATEPPAPPTKPSGNSTPQPSRRLRTK
jgi:hypothetical protein